MTCDGVKTVDGEGANMSVSGRVKSLPHEVGVKGIPRKIIDPDPTKAFEVSDATLGVRIHPQDLVCLQMTLQDHHGPILHAQAEPVEVLD